MSVDIRFKVAAIIGNTFEFYDFVTYAFFATQIGKAFFPSERPFGSLLLSLAVFGSGFVFRPIGALILGSYADNAGRRPALLLSMVLMTAGTFLLALTPSYAIIGVAAPFAVVLARLLQGLALGGEFGVASAFLFEASSHQNRGVVIAWQFASQGMAALTAGCVGLLLSWLLDASQMQDWGWRVPFVLGMGLIPVAIYLRRNMPETLPSLTGKDLNAKPTHRLVSWTVTLAVLVVMGATISTYISLYMTTYATSALNMPPTAAFAATIVAGLATIVFALAGGWASDRLDPRWVMLPTRLLIAGIALPLFTWLIDAPTSGALLAATAILTGLNAMSAAASILIIARIFPPSFRATGVSVVYAVGVSLFGGSTQFVVAWLIAASGNATAPAWYLMFSSLVCAGAMGVLPRTGKPDDRQRRGPVAPESQDQ